MRRMLRRYLFSMPILLQLCVLTACWDFAVYFNTAPLTAVFEHIICTDKAGGVLGYDCKAEPVQNELAVVKACKEALSQLPAIVLALPFGVLSDRIGRKPVLLLFLLGAWLADTWTKLVCLFPGVLPLRLVWLAPLLEAIGGGIQVGPSLFFAMAADLHPGQHRVDAFLKLSSTEMIAQTLATPLAAAMMKRSNWYPLACAWVLIPPAALIALNLPETHPLHRYKELDTDEAEQAEQAERLFPGGEQAGGKATLVERAREAWHQGTRSVAIISKNPVLLVLLSAFLLVCFGSQSWVLLLQVAAKRFGWDYGTASLLFTLRGLTNLALFIVIMPIANAYVSAHFHLSSSERDFKYSLVSCILLIVGFATVGLAGTPLVMIAGLIVSALGSTFLLTLRSAMTYLVPPASTGMLYTAASVAQSIGALIAGPLLALAFSWGMSMGGAWTGAPFLVASAVHLLAFLAISCVRLNHAQSPDNVDELYAGPDDTASEVLRVLLATVKQKYAGSSHEEERLRGRVFDIAGRLRHYIMPAQSWQSVGAIIVASTLLYLSYLSYLITYNLFFHPLAKFAGPRSWAATHVPYAVQQIRGRLPFAIKTLHDEYGEVIRLSPNEISFNCVQAWRDIYSMHGSGRIFTKDPTAVSPSSDGIYNILSTTSIAEHAKIRRVLSSGFSERALRGQEHVVAKYADVLLEQLRRGCAEGPQDMVTWFAFVTFDIIAHLTFGVSLQALESDSYHPWVSGLFGSTMKFISFARVARYFPHVSPLLKLFVPRSLGEQRAKHAAYVRQLVDQKMASTDFSGSNADFLSSVLPYDEAKADLTLPEVYENFGALMIAGSENVASTMEFTLYHVLKHRDVHIRLVGELRSDFDKLDDITFTALNQATYLSAVLNEAMRVHPAAPSAQIRVVPNGGAVVAGHFVPAGARVSVPPYSIYHAEQYFSDPASFLPERWLDGSCDRAAFQPFGIGPRSCMGRNLAMNEMKLILARLLWTFDIELCEEYSNWGEALKIHHLWEVMPFHVLLKVAK